MEITVDGPSACIVIVGAFLMQFIVIGYLKSAGILMREFQAYFNCSNTLILFVTSTTLSLINILSPLFSVLSRRVPLRWMVVTSGLTICLSMCLLYLAFSLPLWVACLGFCTGACLSACYSSVICKVNECFERRRDLANGICFAGSSAGAVAMPLVFTELADRYSVSGCCLLIGAYFLHLVIVGMLIPTSIVTQKHSDTDSQDASKKVAPDAHGASFVGSSSQFGSRFGELAGCPTPSAKPGGARSRSSTGRYSCSDGQPGRQRHDSSARGRLASLSRSQRILTLIYIVATMLSNLGFTTQYVVYPLFLAEFAVPTSTTAVLVAVSGLSDLVARVLTGCLSDRFSWWRKSSIAIFGMTIMGVVCIFTAFCSVSLTDPTNRTVLFAAYAVLAGASGGVYMSIVTSILVLFVGIVNLSIVHSIVCSSWTLSTFPGQTLLGYLKDRTGTFKYSFAIAGLCMICASVVLFLERLVTRDNVDVKDQEAFAGRLLPASDGCGGADGAGKNLVPTIRISEDACDESHVDHGIAEVANGNSNGEIRVEK
ncbi:hypothetical protein BOX15_Mlig008821g1 [Macrostomum lignano]|uniref:Major facilitator superfamily (MFS) profile domain-containing protein n=1 Tax=Macrostomum lignano TaxID=282301 RepID=A0A267DTD2_9PLAT|nr:hypothetical protein BOX15_Mlig008821g1 [Macrostomum lignano]